MKINGPWTWGWLIVAGVFLVLAANCGWYAFSRRNDFASWQIAEPVRVRIDLSTTNSVAAQFTQTCTSSHGVSLRMSDQSGDGFSKITSNDLTGLRAEYSIVDPTGLVVESGQLRHDTFQKWEDENGNEILRLAVAGGFPKGAYTFRLTVAAPAEGMVGRTTEIVARYELCGMEALPVFFAGIFGVGSGLLASVAMFAAFVANRRHARLHSRGSDVS